MLSIYQPSIDIDVAQQLMQINLSTSINFNSLTSSSHASLLPKQALTEISFPAQLVQRNKFAVKYQIFI